jgi:hypothetical protein
MSLYKLNSKAVAQTVETKNKNVQWARLYDFAKEAEEQNNIIIIPKSIISSKKFKEAMRDDLTLKFSKKENLLLVAIQSGWIKNNESLRKFKDSVLDDFNSAKKLFKIETK